MNSNNRGSAVFRKFGKFITLSMVLAGLYGCSSGQDILSTRVASQAIVATTPTPSTNDRATLTETQIAMTTPALTTTVMITAAATVMAAATNTEAAAVPTAVIPPVLALQIQRAAPGENHYFISGDGFSLFQSGDLLVVYAKDFAGFEFTAAVIYIVDKNADNLIAKTIFQNPDVELDSLDALRVDKEFDVVNLARLRSVDTAYVGFVVQEGQIRINPNEPLRIADELLVVQLTASGDTLVTSPPVMLRVEAISTGGEMASVSIGGGIAWPTRGTLLVPRNLSQTFTVQVKDFLAADDICIRQGDHVRISADGIITAGVNIGAITPEGKEHFLLLGAIQTPIDPIYDIIPEFPHGVLMFRIADPSLSATEGWMSYAQTKQFTAAHSGCLEFDINDKVNSDNSGEFNVQVAVNP